VEVSDNLGMLGSKKMSQFPDLREEVHILHFRRAGQSHAGTKMFVDVETFGAPPNLVRLVFDHIKAQEAHAAIGQAGRLAERERRKVRPLAQGEMHEEAVLGVTGFVAGTSFDGTTVPLKLSTAVGADITLLLPLHLAGTLAEQVGRAAQKALQVVLKPTH
jgi:hypothetical protein